MAVIGERWWSVWLRRVVLLLVRMSLRELLRRRVGYDVRVLVLPKLWVCGQRRRVVHAAWSSKDRFVCRISFIRGLAGACGSVVHGR